MHPRPSVSFSSSFDYSSNHKVIRSSICVGFVWNKCKRPACPRQGDTAFPGDPRSKWTVIAERCVFVPAMVSESRWVSAFAAAPHMPSLSVARNIVCIFPTPCRDWELNFWNHSWRVVSAGIQTHQRHFSSTSFQILVAHYKPIGDLFSLFPLCLDCL